GMAYLVRRLLENTSNESWLKAGFLDNASAEELLASPHTSRAPHDDVVPNPTALARRHKLSVAIQGVGNGEPFFSEPMRDFSDAKQREAFDHAVRNAHVPHVANDSTLEQARIAVTKAAAAFPNW